MKSNCVPLRHADSGQAPPWEVGISTRNIGIAEQPACAALGPDPIEVPDPEDVSVPV